MQSIRREWREGKVRPIPGNPPHDRPVSRGYSFTFWRICDDPFPATPHPPQATLARPVCVFQAWRNLSVRWGSKPKPKTQTKTQEPLTRAGVPPPVGRPPMPGKGRDGRNYAPCSSSAMSSGRLFLDGLLASRARLRFTGNRRLTCTSQRLWRKGTFLLCWYGGHFYFALTSQFSRLTLLGASSTLSGQCRGRP